MIDRKRRAEFAELLRRFAAGQLTNDEYEDRAFEILPVPARHAEDQGLWPIMEMSWFLYDDLHKHRLDGKYKLTRDGRREVCRWILFLQSDCEYEWPRKSFHSLLAPILKLVTLGWWGRRQQEDFESAGEVEVWPFLRRADYEAALRCPLLLARSA